MKNLPIHEVAGPLVDACRDCNRVIIQAPTGSGKSTRVPRILLDSGLMGAGRIVVLQPRRLAARMLAARVAAECGSRLGAEVGYQIRMDRVWGDQSRIVYVTEGILLRWMLSDPQLNGVAAVIFDEFHERHLFAEVTLARALDLQETGRKDLRILVMSATLDGAALQTFLSETSSPGADPAPVRLVESAGRTYPVAIEYLARSPGDAPVWELAARAVGDAHGDGGGHTLVFMPGAYEISRTISELRHRFGSGVPVLPLHGELPPGQQDAAVATGGPPRIIVATNVAETSLTIDGVTLVVDSGLARIARYDSRRGINTLYVEKISHASAAQRSGRAGRTAPGRCLRLWTMSDHERRPPKETPEVLRVDLAETLLTLRASGVTDVRSFRWLDPPGPMAVSKAEALLFDLGAIASVGGDITRVGRQMLSFPVHPRYARMFVAAQELGCVSAAATIAALTQTRNLFLKADRRVCAERERIFGSGRSDFLILMRVLAWAREQGFRIEPCRALGIHADSARQAARLNDQFLQIAVREGLKIETGEVDEESIARCILAGFSDQVACRRSAGTLLCDLVHGRRGMLARDSVVQQSRLLVVAEIHEIEGRTGDTRVVLNLATGIEEAWLHELFPDVFSEDVETCFDPSQKRVVIQTRKVFRDLVIEEHRRDASPSAAASACLAHEVTSGNLTLKQWDGAVEQWISRVNFLAEWMPELGIPPIGPADREIIVAEICDGATAYREIKERPVRHAVESWLTPEQRRTFERMVPDRIDLPGGRRAKVIYAGGATPSIAVRIQDLYGVHGTLSVCGGRVPLQIQILAPNMRPVQITSDLRNFWDEIYPKLKPLLSRRYPKHEWR